MNPTESEARSFLNALFANKPDTAYVLIWTLIGDIKQSRWFRDVSPAAAYVESLSGCNVYVGIGLSPSDFGEFKRCESENVAGLIGLGADIDLKSDAHPKGSRPTTIEQALSILPHVLPPTIIIETGNGVQCWWLFKEVWIFSDVCDRQQAAALSARWQTLLKYNAQRNGWTFERLKDLARVLRVPGTQNVKDTANPKNVTIRSFTNRRYSPSDFCGYLDDLAIPDEDEKARAVKALAEHSGGKNLTIDLAAAVPAEQLERWEEQDARFCSTWNHQRTDLHDESQSGYDLALAWFGVRHELDNQQIVDLIIHNRRFHGAKQSKSFDYYCRTISKARNGTGEDMAADCPAVTTPASGESIVRVCSADPNEKAKLCEKISTIIGVQIVRIVKLNGQEPVFLMEFEEGGCIQFPDVSKLITQRSFKTALAAKAGKILRRFHAREWEQLAQMMLDACTIEQGTDDLQLEGEARQYASRYLSAVQFIQSSAGQPVDTMYRPMIHDGKIAVSATDMQIYMNRTMGESRSVKSVAAMLAAIGGKSVRIRGNGFREQSRWALPIEEFDPKDYPQPEGNHE